VVACLLIGSAVATPITYEEVTVGNPGNANDTGGTFNGAVNYAYQIGKYDVTIGQYAAFLNAADPNGTNPNGIYNSSMETDLTIAGISYTSGASAGSKYSVIGPSGTAYGQTGANRPITYVSWFDAARFANWMTNGQGAGSTETGAYTLGDATSGNAVAANPGAAFYIPTENQWYKAAYYDPTLNSGAGGYYAYATQSDTAPGNLIGSTANQANYAAGQLFSVSQSGTYDANQNYLTDVGAFSGSGSFYGTFDQSGNVYQWNDLDGTPGSSRGLEPFAALVISRWAGHRKVLCPVVFLGNRGRERLLPRSRYTLSSPVPVNRSRHRDERRSVAGGHPASTPRGLRQQPHTGDEHRSVRCRRREGAARQ